MRPRSVRRAAAQLQTLFDSSLTFSSTAMATDCRKGTTGPIISPTVQVNLDIPIIWYTDTKGERERDLFLCSLILITILL